MLRFYCGSANEAISPRDTRQKNNHKPANNIDSSNFKSKPGKQYYRPIIPGTTTRRGGIVAATNQYGETKTFAPHKYGGNARAKIAAKRFASVAPCN